MNDNLQLRTAMPDSLPTAAPLSWAKPVLRLAGIYNLAWGAFTVLWPHLIFDLTDVPRINYPEIWQCVGMIVGVYGIGYWIAASDPRRHWPIILVGLLGKVFGPIGFVFALARGVFTSAFGVTNITNDLIWWLPFTLVLWDAFMNRSLPPKSAVKRQVFVKESRIPATPTEVFRFHESPDALKLLMPPKELLKLEQAPTSLAPGAFTVFGGSLFGLPLRWVAVHTEYDPPRMFADQEHAGPFDYWYHRHTFADDGNGGTLLRDEIEYALPFGFWGRLLAGWLVRKKFRAIFDYRHDATRKALQK